MDEFITKLLQWHTNNYREFPWRIEKDPYRLMIAEFMLQRTRADQVAPIYCQFIKLYPDIKTLEKSNINDVSILLKPLGLYWRANHFKTAAQYIIREYGGAIPSEKEKLLKIPGIGDYVSGAILAVAFGKCTNVVDSNIARVINRYYGLNMAGEIRRNKIINKYSLSIFCSGNPKNILFAFIDFSSIICTPLQPNHEACPVKNNCMFYKKIIQNQ